MNIEIPVGLLIVMTILNIMLIIVVVTGFIYPKMILGAPKDREQRNRVEDKTTF